MSKTADAETVDHFARGAAQRALDSVLAHEKLCEDRWSELRRTVDKFDNRLRSLVWVLIGLLAAIAGNAVTNVIK